jgi:ABC-type phosphate transport system substrate-binding protein
MALPRIARLAVPRRRFITWLAGTGVAALGETAEAGTGFQVIVNEGNSLSSVSRELLGDIFLKRRSEWQDGVSARPVDLKPDAPARKAFSQDVLRRSVAAVKSYWQQLIFSGRGVPPPELDSEQAVVAHVMSHRGAVGYVSVGTELGRAKVLLLR